MESGSALMECGNKMVDSKTNWKNMILALLQKR